MCSSSRGAHLSLIRCRPQCNGFHMDSKLSQMDPGKMKRCPYPYLGGDLLQWEEILRGTERGNAVTDTVPERNKRVEISSLALAHHVSVNAYVITAKHFGAIAFHCICQVVQHAISSMTDAKEELLQVCQKLPWSLWNWHCVRFQDWC